MREGLTSFFDGKLSINVILAVSNELSIGGIFLNVFLLLGLLIATSIVEFEVLCIE